MEMTATDLSAVIKACADSGVTTFKTGDLEIHFGDKQTTPQTQTYSSLADYGAVIPPAPQLTDDELAERADIENANLLFEDPIAWEESQMTKIKGEG